MYSGGFYPYSTQEEKWAFWSRNIYINRYMDPPKAVYEMLLQLVKKKDYFVITTNVDHCFQKAGFDKQRLFYTQGDYGLWQCSKPCHPKTYDNEDAVKKMLAEQKDMKIPSELVPRCPVCGALMSMSLRTDDTFVEDAGWHAAAKRYDDFLCRYEGLRVLYMELGVGGNTPVIIKYPFWQMTYRNAKAIYACVNLSEAYAPKEIQQQSLCLKGDIGDILHLLICEKNQVRPENSDSLSDRGSALEGASHGEGECAVSGVAKSQKIFGFGLKRKGILEGRSCRKG